MKIERKRIVVVTADEIHISMSIEEAKEFKSQLSKVAYSPYNKVVDFYMNFCDAVNQKV